MRSLTLQPIVDRLFELHFGRHVAQLVHGPRMDLPNPLLAHAHLGAELAKRPRRLAVEAKAGHHDLLLPGLQVAEKLVKQLLQFGDLRG